MLHAHNLVIDYGPIRAVNNLTWTVAAGEVVGLLGGNGAGKSSTLRAAAGINPPTSGVLTVAGHDMTTPDGVEAARHVIGYCPDVGGLIRQATVREHIGLALAMRNATHLWPQAIDLVDQFGLLHVLDRVTSGFSHGMSRRLSVLLAALTATSLLILDEPFDGVDPVGVDATMRVIDNARAAGVAVVISTHLLDLLAHAADIVNVMSSGHILDTAPARDFTGHTGKQRYTNLLLHGTPVG